MFMKQRKMIETQKDQVAKLHDALKAEASKREQSQPQQTGPKPPGAPRSPWARLLATKPDAKPTGPASNTPSPAPNPLGAPQSPRAGLRPEWALLPVGLLILLSLLSRELRVLEPDVPGGRGTGPEGAGPGEPRGPEGPREPRGAAGPGEGCGEPG